MRLLVVKSRWGHMGTKSGFPLWEVLRGVLPAGQVEEVPVPLELPAMPPSPWHTRIARRLGVRSSPAASAEWVEADTTAGSPWATIRHRHAARAALAILDRDQEAVVLLPAAEDEFCADFARARQDMRRRIFVCFHQPPAWFRLNWDRTEELESLGGIFCLGEAQTSYFRSVCRTPIHLIRHGVRHDFFQPPEDVSARKGNRLLFVGQWLRDFETLADAMALVWSRRPDTRLESVVPRFARDSAAVRRLAADQRVTWHAELSDEALRDLYQASDLLFLPVSDAVANNAVLEALASGLPVVSTDVGGMAEYVPSGAGELCRPRDAGSHADALVRWLDNAAGRAEAGVLARRSAVENFDWGNIGRQLAGCIIK
jgi:glycosyltransferase involved in cell wall biosynthesis